MKKTCLIVGVTSELGRCCASAWRALGWRVIGTARLGADDERCPSGIEVIALDLADTEQINDVLVAIPGCPDLVINCAATYARSAKKMLSQQDIAEIFAVNTIAPYYLNLELLKRKPDQQSACFIFIGTAAMFNADKESGVYAASKAALRVLTTSLADYCRERNAAAMWLVLGHLENAWKVNEIRKLAELHGIDEASVRNRFLRKAEPNSMIDQFISFDKCVEAMQYMSTIGPMGNGVVLRLDGGASSSLV